MGESERRRLGPRFIMGDGVTLRQIEREDLPHVRRWLDDPELRGMIGATKPLSEAEAEEWFEGVVADESRAWYVIIRDEDDGVIGECGLLRMFPEWRTTDMSIVIGERDAWGKGYGTEVGRLLLDFAFEYMGMHRVAVGVVGFHEDAIQFWEKLGFVREGVQRDGYFHEGEFSDFVMMSLLEREWRGRRGGVGFTELAHIGVARSALAQRARLTRDSSPAMLRAFSKGEEPMSRGPTATLILVFLLAGISSTSAVLADESQPEGCLLCHQGIESIGEKHDALSCVDCHQGNADARARGAAHEGLYPNPGDLNIVEETCGLCHGAIVSTVKKSLHATSAGVISGARYLWAAQEDKNALYGVRQVRDEDGDVPWDLGALEELEALPHYGESEQPVDDYLRNQCLRCHVWTEGAKRHGDYRASGCSACHVLYADDGLSHSADLTIPRDEPGHPIRHEITTKIPAEQCVHCHNRGGRTGVSFLGMMESDGYGTPFAADGGKQPKLHGKHYNHLQKDLHFEAGMDCIDCHTLDDIHGDGNIYSKREQAVEVECTDCHGNLGEYSDLTTSRGNRMTNTEKQNDGAVLRGKTSGRTHRIPQVRSLNERNALPVAMQIEGHMDGLECYACHSRWAPQCYGCHTRMDMGKRGYDWVDAAEDGTYKWQESRSYLRWETPTLGINSEGKVSPFIPGCQAIFTRIGEDGEAVELNKVFTTADGHSGIAHNPIQPHTVSRETRTCEDCHSEPKALGLGSGHYVTAWNGVDVPFELERIVDEDGRQIQATSHVGARPFNREEMEKIGRSNVCLGCHQETPSMFWRTVEERWGEAKTSKVHQEVLRELLRGATDVDDEERE